MRLTIFSFLLVSSFTYSQSKLSVNVHGVPSSKGKISVAIYNQADGFLKFDTSYAHNSVIAKEGITQLSFKNLPEGEYALAIFHDENGNDKLDKNWLGIPKEKVAFSKAKMKMFGPPEFKECAFLVKSDMKIDITL